MPLCFVHPATKTAKANSEMQMVILFMKVTPLTLDCPRQRGLLAENILGCLPDSIALDSSSFANWSISCADSISEVLASPVALLAAACKQPPPNRKSRADGDDYFPDFNLLESFSSSDLTVIKFASSLFFSITIVSSQYPKGA